MIPGGGGPDRGRAIWRTVQKARESAVFTEIIFSLRKTAAPFCQALSRNCFIIYARFLFVVRSTI